MSAIFAWLQAAPSGAISFVGALVAALVAVFVTALTQWILGRRARSELLTKKLEELYLALNDASTHNVARCNAALPLVSATPFSKVNVASTLADSMGLNLHKKIIMYVRLYFPQLSNAHQEVFRLNSEVNDLIYEAETGPPLVEEALVQSSGKYGEALSSMESEIIANRSSLVRESIVPRRYARET